MFATAGGKEVRQTMVHVRKLTFLEL